MKAFDAVSEAATDKEHLYNLIKFCIIPKVYHMFSAASSLDAIADFAETCHKQHIIFFQRFLNNGKELDADTKHSFDLATLLTRQGGIQFTSPLQFYIAGFLATWSRLFYVGSPTTQVDSEDSTPSPLHASILSIIEEEVETPTILCCVDYNRAFDKLMVEHPDDFGLDIAGGQGVRGLIQAAATDKLQHAIVEATTRNRYQEIYNRLGNDEATTGKISHLRKIMPSSAQLLGSDMCDNRDMGKKKMPSNSFHLFLQIKLGLPILHDIKAGAFVDCPFCSKSKALDRFGDHVFACKHFLAQRTTCMHNPMRNAFAYVLDTLAKIGSSKSSMISSVTIEKPGLVPNTAVRPADVYATLKSEKEVLDCDGQTLPVTSIAFDITYATISDSSGCDGIKNTSSFSPAAFPHLITAENKKRTDAHDGRTPGGTAVYLANKSIAFIPLAIDYPGAMGASMSFLLLGTLTGRRPDRGAQHNISKIPADLAAARWVTPKQVASDDPKQYIPPFHPAAVNGQFKAASEQLKREAKESDAYDAWLVHTDFRKLAMDLSTCHAHGVAQVAEIFVSSRSAAKGTVACLPSFSGSKSYVEKEVSKAVQFLKNLPGEDELLFNAPRDPLYSWDDGNDLGEEDDYDTKAREDTGDGSPPTHQRVIESGGGDMEVESDGETTLNLPPTGDFDEDSTHNSTPSRRLLASGIGIVSPLLAVDAAHALRELLQATSVSEDALQKLFAKHGIRVQTARFDARVLARRILRILELSFHCVATLPRELPRTLDSAADVTELLASLTFAAP